MDAKTQCPNCGSRTPPAEVVVGGIRYYNCVRCDFSTWNQREYNPPRQATYMP